MIGLENFGGLRGRLAVGGHDAVGAEVIIVREVAEVASVCEEFELAFRAGEVGEIERKYSRGIHGLIRERDVNGTNVAIEGPVPILGIMRNADREPGRFDRTFVVFFTEELSIDNESEDVTGVAGGDGVPVVFPVVGSLDDEGAPSCVVNEEFQVPVSIEFEGP